MKQVLLAAALVTATSLPAAAQLSTPELQRQWLDLKRRKVELLERQQADKEEQAREQEAARYCAKAWVTPDNWDYCKRFR